jgi:indole-3-glycerol phosphate synthase
MNFLLEIINRKRARLAASKAQISFERIEEQAREVRMTATANRLRASIGSAGLNVIAEFKRRSPSKGVIRPVADAREIACAYEVGGAKAISVLTEEDYFDGSIDDLRVVKSAVELPLLRKDFVFEEYQVFEAAAAGADAILLIVAALDDETLGRLRQLAEDELGMDALVEVHDELEMKRAHKCGARLIGVNNRNLHTFEVSLSTSLKLSNQAPANSVLISESGLRTAEDLKRLAGVGYRGFLIGESLMRAENPGEALSALLS